MNEHDPPPLTDPGSGAPALLRDALAGARARTPKPADLARLAARLPLGSPPAGRSSGPAPAVPPPSVLSGAMIGAALGVVVSGVALLWDAGHAPPPPAPIAVVTVAGEAPRGARIEATATPPAISPPPAATAAPTSVPRAVQAPASAAAPAPPLDARADPGPPADPGPGSAGAGAPPGDAETEAHLLRRAMDALGASPAQALALTEEHAARFPAGPLGQEREVVAIQALVRLGRVTEARARAARFVAAFPGSAHRTHLEALVAP